MLYKLLRSQLAQQSDHFSALFTLKPEDPGEGMSDSNPIVLHGVVASEFDYICAYITGQFDDSVEGLAALLNLGSFLQMSRPRNYALQQLNALPAWSPFLKLHLGVRNQIDVWTQASFRHIVLHIPLEEITMKDMLCIGGPAFWAIVQAKNRILEHRRLLAFDWPEAVHGPNCRLSTACGLTWKSEWWYTFAKCILHPDNHYSATDALKEVELTDIDYMKDECKALTIRAVREDGALEQSEEIIEEALKTFLQFIDQ
ncbi:hypothetical protein GSI_03257 [Ganoderma sinense ZZ0214-1]|uniref:BTB domain-containing protein n=1 Tax=Ganoderma sinense ZZ0214-1 TaxID=1077348 RepID=A0A2G8SL50_9APHY|nr:hypothetical protein GSI_03257 [Ganoderma sinense ZZ0214-1]